MNVLVYAHDPTDPVKHEKAIQLIERLSRGGSLVVSVQVLNEFYAAATRPNRPPSLSHGEAGAIIRDVAAVATVVPLTASVTLLGLAAVEHHQLSFWDALIWAAAKEHGISVVHTEDQPGQREIEGVRYANPFQAA